MITFSLQVRNGRLPKEAVRTLVVAALISAALGVMTPPGISRAATSRMSAMHIAILPSSGPHAIGPKTLITFHLQVRGVTLDPRHIGKGQVPGHGHIQVYLDRIPSDAGRRADLTGMVAVAGASSFSIGFTPSWVRLHAGHHRFLLVLARNDNVLYPTHPASFPVTVR